MGSKPDAKPSFTPKLSLYSLPTKPSEPAGMLTPPLRPPASVPFLWEEAPGKPRTCDFKPVSARSLELPPRLLSEIKITNLPSPTTVLDGPYVRRSASCSSFRDMGLEKWHLGHVGAAPEKRDKERLVGFWGKKSVKGKRDKSHMEGSDVCFVGSREREGCGEDDQTKVKITRLRRNRSLLNTSSTSTHFWSSIYESLRHVVPWRVRKLKKDGLL